MNKWQLLCCEARKNLGGDEKKVPACFFALPCEVT